MSEDHKEIWLECKCGDFSYEGRQWCEDDAFDSSDHGPECTGSVKYIRADLHEALMAENERLQSEWEKAAQMNVTLIEGRDADAMEYAQKARAKAIEEAAAVYASQGRDGLEWDYFNAAVCAILALKEKP